MRVPVKHNQGPPMALSGKSAVSKPVSHSYVLMVQHLIEKCLIMYMDLDDCCKSLAKYARVKPAVTVAVWRGLEKENAEFFRQYLLKRTENRAKAFDQALEEATAKFCNQTLRADLHVNGCGQSKVRQAVKSCPIGAPLRSSIAVHSG